MISPTLSGPARKGGQLGTNQKDLEIKYNCISPGTAKVTMGIPFVSPDDDDTVETLQFMWTVVCREAPRAGFRCTDELLTVALPPACCRLRAARQPIPCAHLRRVQTTDVDAVRTAWRTAESIVEDGEAVSTASHQFGVSFNMEGEVEAQSPSDMLVVTTAKNMTRFLLSMDAKPTSSTKGNKKQKMESQPFLTPGAAAHQKARHSSAPPPPPTLPVFAGALMLPALPSARAVVRAVEKGIANPALAGQGRRGGTARSSLTVLGQKVPNQVTLDVMYNCFGIGTATIGAQPLPCSPCRLPRLAAAAIWHGCAAAAD